MNIINSKSTSSSLNKVPEVTFLFWVIKIMATTVSETGADYLSYNLRFGIGITCLIMSVVFIVTLVMQIKSQRYIPWIYWFTVVLISIVGTLITDNLVDNYSVTLEATTIIFTLGLIAIFAIWYKNEKTLSIHTIYNVKRELFYWSAILFTFALGTAAGDLFAEGMQLGYLTSAFIFGSAIAAVTIGYYFFKLNAVLAFWLAYILTRPFGASCGDFLSQPTKNGGLGLGVTSTSIVFLAVIIGLVIYLTIKERGSHNRTP